MSINGSGPRKCTSWIESFVEWTSNLESTPVWCRWSAISAVAAALERKVWCTTSAPLYPNLYVFLVGDAGLGKSRPIDAAHAFLTKIPDFKFGATSMTMASLVDHMSEAKKVIIRLTTKEDPLEYHTLTIVADELSAFMHEYDNGLIAGLTKFYDCSEYSQGRRVGDIRIKIANPQLNILSGTTPSNLLHFIPEPAWEQGFTSRVILVFSEESERQLIDVFNTPSRPMPLDMIHDLELISKLYGQFGWTEEWAKGMHNWREAGMKVEGFTPPTHPRLKHYCSRRFAHMIKLSMISSVDRHNLLILEKEDFNRAMGWLISAEERMGKIFEGGTAKGDSAVMDEITHFVNAMGQANEAQVVQFTRKRVQFAGNIPKIIEQMEKGGMLVHSGNDRLGLRIFKGGQT